MTADHDTLADRVLAAIDETEADAQQAVGEFNGPYWTLLHTDDVIYDGYEGQKAWSVLEQLPRRGRQIGNHIVRQDPHSTLRRCEADRKIVAEVRGLSSGVLKDDLVASLGDLVLSLLADAYGITVEEM